MNVSNRTRKCSQSVAILPQLAVRLSVDLGDGSSVQLNQHPPESDGPVASEYEGLYNLPVEGPINAEAQPLASAIRRRKEQRIGGKALDVGAPQPEGDRGRSAKFLKRHKRFPAGKKIRMAKGISLGGFGQGKAQAPQLFEDSFCRGARFQTFSTFARSLGLPKACTTILSLSTGPQDGFSATNHSRRSA